MLPFSLLQHPAYAALGISALAAALWTVLRLAENKQDKQDDPRPDQDNQENYHAPSLRIRPLKPSIDLEIYTYM